MPINDGMFTSNTDMWATPQHVFDELDREFGFTLDVCAVLDNAKCEQFYSPEMDGLAQEWTGVCWMNPPYGRQIKHWVQKAYEASVQGATVVCLLPARTDTRWFHDYCMHGEIRFIKGRLQFINSEKKMNNAPFPNMIVVFRPKYRSVIL